MTSEEWKKTVLENAEKDYGICPPPTKAQDGLNALIDHFLGEDWYVALSVNQEQVNSEAVYQILKLYPKRLTFREWLMKIFRT